MDNAWRMRTRVGSPSRENVSARAPAPSALTSPRRTRSARGRSAKSAARRGGTYARLFICSDDRTSGRRRQRRRAQRMCSARGDELVPGEQVVVEAGAVSHVLEGAEALQAVGDLLAAGHTQVAPGRLEACPPGRQVEVDGITAAEEDDAGAVGGHVGEHS